MNAIAERARRPGKVEILVIAAAVAVGAYLQAAVGEPPGERRGATHPAATEAAAIPQAAWKVRVFPAGKPRGGKGPAGRAFRAARSGVVPAVKQIHDTLVLEPARAQMTLRSLFAPRARAAIGRARIVLPARATQIRTLKRTSAIGIDGATARRASATTLVAAKGVVDERRFRMRLRSQLWLEKTRSGWRVIAFDIKRVPRR